MELFWELREVIHVKRFDQWQPQQILKCLQSKNILFIKETICSLKQYAQRDYNKSQWLLMTWLP